MLGDVDGLRLGEIDGLALGTREGLVVGPCEGETLGELDGLPLGDCEGESLGANVTTLTLVSTSSSTPPPAETMVTPTVCTPIVIPAIACVSSLPSPARAGTPSTGTSSTVMPHAATPPPLAIVAETETTPPLASVAVTAAIELAPSPKYDHAVAVRVTSHVPVPGSRGPTVYSAGSTRAQSSSSALVAFSSGAPSVLSLAHATGNVTVTGSASSAPNRAKYTSPAVITLSSSTTSSDSTLPTSTSSSSPKLASALSGIEARTLKSSDAIATLFFPLPVPSSNLAASRSALDRD